MTSCVKSELMSTSSDHFDVIAHYSLDPMTCWQSWRSAVSSARRCPPWAAPGRAAAARWAARWAEDSSGSRKPGQENLMNFENNAMACNLGYFMFSKYRSFSLYRNHRKKHVVDKQMISNHPIYPWSEQSWITCLPSSLCLLSRLDICSAVSDRIRSAGFVM